jgi:hypothetical protein
MGEHATPQPSTNPSQTSHGLRATNRQCLRTDSALRGFP